MRLQRFFAVLGMGLVILWALGLGSVDASTWLTWIDGLAAILSFSFAAYIPDVSAKVSDVSITRRSRIARPAILAVGLFISWIIAANTGVVAWQRWWTFGFGCAFFVLVFYAASERFVAPGTGTRALTPEEQKRFRKGA